MPAQAFAARQQATLEPAWLLISAPIVITTSPLGSLQYTNTQPLVPLGDVMVATMVSSQCQQQQSQAMLPSGLTIAFNAILLRLLGWVRWVANRLTTFPIIQERRAVLATPEQLLRPELPCMLLSRQPARLATIRAPYILEACKEKQ